MFSEQGSREEQAALNEDEGRLRGPEGGDTAARGVEGRQKGRERRWAVSHTGRKVRWVVTDR